MRPITCAVAVAVLLHCGQTALARKWPGDDGKLVEGELVLVRDGGVVIELDGPEGKLFEIGDASLRDLDHRFLAKNHGYRRPLPAKPRAGKNAEALRHLDGCLMATRHQPGPAEIVREVNYLHGLGRERAIDVLREYVVDEPVEGWGGVDRIVPLLFSETAGMPGLDDELDVAPAIAQAASFITLAGEQPFDNSYFARFYPMPTHRALVEAAAAGRAFRTRPLRPADDPLAAAEEAILANAAKRGGDGGLEFTRREAWTCIAPLFPLEWECFFVGIHGLGCDDSGWAKLKELTAILEVTWSEKDQSYIAKHRDRLPPPAKRVTPASEVLR